MSPWDSRLLLRSLHERAGLSALLLLALSSVVAGADEAARKDRFGDPLPVGAVRRLGTQRLWHDSSVSLMAFSPDGKVLATAGNISRTDQELTIQLWEIPSGRRLARWVVQQGRDLLALTFSPDGKLLASAGWQNGVSLWSVPDGKEKRHLKNRQMPEDGGVTSLAFAPDGKTLAVGEMSGGVTLWDLVGDRRPRRYTLHDGQAQFLAFSPDGEKMAALVAKHGTCVVDVAGGVELWRTDSALPFAFTSDGKSLVVVKRRDGGDEITFHDAVSGERRGKPRQLPGLVHDLVRTSDAKILAAGARNYRARLWDAASGEEVISLQGELKLDHLEMALSADGKMLAGADGATIHLWGTATGRERRAEMGHGEPVSFAGVAAAGKTLVTVSGDSIRLWDAVTGAPRRRLGRGRIQGVHLSPDGKSLTWVNRTTDDVPHLHLWDILADTETRRADVEKDLPLFALAFTADGKSLAWGSNGTMQDGVHLWDVAGGRLVRRFGIDWSPQALAFTPDGKRLAVAAFRSLDLWDPATGERLRRLTNEEQADQLAFSPDGKLLASWKPGLPILVWDVERGTEIRRLGGRKFYPRALRLFSPDGRYLALVGQENTLHLYDVRSGDEFRRFPGPRHFDRARINWLLADPKFVALSDVALSADGKTLAAEQPDGSIRLWEVATGAERRHFAGHEGGVRALTFLSDHRRLASGGEDTTALVWDTTGLGDQASEKELSARDLDHLWAELAGEAAPAYRALWRLALSPRWSVPFLAERLHPVAAPEPARVRQMIADLASDTFGRREQARRELLELAELADKPLRAALEMRRRLEELIARLDESMPPPGQARMLRAIEALEHAGGTEARRVLQTLAGGTAAARVTKEAQAALRRLGRS
jgi:WD40 repeat protein